MPGSNEHTFITGSRYGLADIRHRGLQSTIGDRCLSYFTLANGGAGAKNDIDSSAAINFTIGGLMKTKAQLADTNVIVTDAWGDTKVQGGDTTCYYVLTLDAAGTIRCYKGKDGEIKSLPGYPDGECGFGVVKVVNAQAASATFAFGVTDFDAAGVTATFTSCAVIPSTAP